ncbi:hypothetical protein PoB_001332600 [Plakobranchus ocellatus]|uniref:SMP-30/Gluconolactonase/LRE-like region domain-containing protein n=1 Tax=Plakobranchus ocellatus TaxID=259542 RepID=A0AAV3YTR8_9GAST|nr:hypothetical protein PoB_001332600 [Plakobranchus ocellatus]
MRHRLSQSDLHYYASTSTKVHFNRGVAVDQAGNVFYTDTDSQQLHFLRYDGEAECWGGEEGLWKLQTPQDGDELWGVDVRDGICVCATIKGRFYVLDLEN